MSTQFQNANKIKFMPLPYIGMFDLDLIYQTSDAELLYQVLFKVNEIAKSQNIIVDNFQKVIEWATEQIETFTRQQLQEWLSDGTMGDIINEEIFGELNTKIDNIKVPFTVIIGDSYVLQPNSWGNVYKTILGLSDSQCYIYGSYGAGFGTGGSGGQTYLNILQNNISKISNKNDIKYVIVGCGYNDASYSVNKNTLVNAINTFCDYVEGNLPNAKVLLVGCGYNINLNDTGRLARYNMQKVVLDAYGSSDIRKNCSLVYNSNLWLHDSSLFLSSDGFHPNVEGGYVIGANLVKSITSPCTVIHRNISLNLNIYSNTKELTLEAMNNILYMMSNSLDMTFNQTITPNTFVSVGTFTSNGIFPQNTNTCRFTVKAVYTTSSGSYMTDVIIMLSGDGTINMMLLNNKNDPIEIINFNILPFNTYIDLSIN